MKRFLPLIFALFVFTNIGAQNLKINEFMASNDSCFADENGEYDDWIEIYNADAIAINIGGMYITDDLTDPTAWQIPDTDSSITTIQPGGFLVLWADKKPEQGILHVKLKLSGGGEQIGLFKKDGVTPIDTLTFGEQTTDVSCGRLPDGSDHWALFPKHHVLGYTASPGKSNVTIRINEFMASNDTTIADDNGKYSDWIELYNYGTEAIDIGGMYISDDANDVTQYSFSSAVIQPEEYFLIWCDGSGNSSVPFHTNFKLSKGGEQIVFALNKNTIIDSLTYTDQKTDVSYGRLPDGAGNWQFFTQPTPGASNSIAVSVPNEKSVPMFFSLSQNYPNPFGSGSNVKSNFTSIKFRTTRTGFVTLEVFNLLGQKVATLIKSNLNAGEYNVKFNASQLTSGVYFYSLKAGSLREIKKMILIK